MDMGDLADRFNRANCATMDELVKKGVTRRIDVANWASPLNNAVM
jgi:hypothetical protein